MNAHVVGGMADNASRRTGLVLACLGALLLSVDTLLIRLIDDTHMFRIVFWRGLLMSGSASVFCLVVPSARAMLIASFGRRGFWIASMCYGAASIAFVCALAHTSVADALFIVSTAPLWAAFLSLLFLKERTPLPACFAMLAALCGIAIAQSGGTGRLVGNVLAAVSALGLSGAFVSARTTRANTAFAPCVGGLLSAIAVGPFLSHATFPYASQWGWMALEGAVVMPVSFVLIAACPRFIPAAQLSLVLLMETVLGPVWVSLALGERPGQWTLMGGAIVLGALVLHSASGSTWGNGFEQSARSEIDAFEGLTRINAVA